MNSLNNLASLYVGSLTALQTSTTTIENSRTAKITNLAAKVIQRAWRFRQVKYQPKDPNTDLEALQLNQKKRNLTGPPFLNVIPRPLKNVYKIDVQKSLKWVEAHASCDQETARQFLGCLTYRTHAQFEKQLSLTIHDFNRHLMSYPTGQRRYIIYVDKLRNLDKSQGWVQLLALKYLLTDSLVEITDNMNRVREKFNSILVCDDAAYSGSQMACTLQSLCRISDVFVAVPFMTQRARKRIELIKNRISNRLKICNYQLMPTFGELNFTKDKSNFAKSQLYNKFNLECGTVFNHKIADNLSIPTYIIRDGFLINGAENVSIPFVVQARSIPPYKIHSRL